MKLRDILARAGSLWPRKQKEGAPQNAPSPKKKKLNLDRTSTITFVVIAVIAAMAASLHTPLNAGSSWQIMKVPAAFLVSILVLATIIAIFAFRESRGGMASGSPEQGGQEAGSTTTTTTTGTTKRTTTAEKKTEAKSRWRVAGGIFISLVFVAVAVYFAARYEPWLINTGEGRAVLLFVSLLVIGAAQNKGLRKFAITMVAIIGALVFIMGGPRSMMAAYQTAQLTQTQRNLLQHPNWGKHFCDEGEPQDYEESSVAEISIVPKPGCFQGTVKVPFAWDSFRIKQTCEDGGWYQIWQDGDREPSPIHPCYEAMDQDFVHNPNRGRTRTFRYQGEKMKFKLYPIVWKP